MPSGSFRYTKTKDSMGLYVFALDWSHKDFHDRTISIPLKIKGYVSITMACMDFKIWRYQVAKNKKKMTAESLGIQYTVYVEPLPAERHGLSFLHWKNSDSFF